MLRRAEEQPPLIKFVCGPVRFQPSQSNDVSDAEEDQPLPPDYHAVVGQSPPDYDTAVGGLTDTEDPTEQVAQSNDAEDDPKEQIASHRDRSQSIWLYFPHVELVFLLYSVQGSLTTQLTVLRDGDGAMFYTAAIVLVSITALQRRQSAKTYPNIVWVCRIFRCFGLC